MGFFLFVATAVALLCGTCVRGRAIAGGHRFTSGSLIESLPLTALPNYTHTCQPSPDNLFHSTCHSLCHRHCHAHRMCRGFTFIDFPSAATCELHSESDEVEPNPFAFFAPMNCSLMEDYDVPWPLAATTLAKRYPDVAEGSLLVPVGIPAQPAPDAHPTFSRVTEGAGIYQPPAHTDLSLPISTNKFWTHLIIGDGMTPIFPMPYALQLEVADDGHGTTSYQVKVSQSGASVEGKGRLREEGRVQYYYNPVLRDIAIGAIEPIDGFAVTSESLLGATLSLRHNGLARVDLPITQGMAYVSARYTGSTPRLSTQHAIVEVVDEGGGVGHLKLTNGQEWRLYVLHFDGSPQEGYVWEREAPVGGEGEGEGGEQRVSSVLLWGERVFSGMVRAALITKPSERAVFDAHAGTWVVGGGIEVPESDDGKTYQFRWTIEGKKNEQALHFALPHHMDILTDQTERTDITLQSQTKGVMTAVLGNVWTMEEPDQHQLPFIFRTRSIDDYYQKEIREVLAREVDAFDIRAETQRGSWYLSGKGMQKLAYMCLVGFRLDGRDGDLTQRCVKKLRAALDCYVTRKCSGPVAPRLLYDVSWGGLVSAAGATGGPDGLLADFGNAAYNDHHYQFGYFILSAAVLGFLDEQWLTRPANVDFANTLVRDVANPSASDSWFPLFRALDWYHGHSWSRGILPSIHGKDQGSISEEVNAFYGIYMWAHVTKQWSLKRVARLILNVNARSHQHYFLLDKDNENHPSDFVKNKVVGLLFENRADYTTWFGDNATFIHGIHMLPLTPALLLSRTERFTIEEWDSILKTHSAGVGPTDPWRSIILAGGLAFVDKAAAYAALKAPLQALDDGLSRAWALFWTAAVGKDRLAPPTADTATTAAAEKPSKAPPKGPQCSPDPAITAEVCSSLPLEKGESVRFDASCKGGMLGCYAQGKACCRYCDTGDYESIPCDDAASASAMQVSQPPAPSTPPSTPAPLPPSSYAPVETPGVCEENLTVTPEVCEALSGALREDERVTHKVRYDASCRGGVLGCYASGQACCRYCEGDGAFASVECGESQGARLPPPRCKADPAVTPYTCDDLALGGEGDRERVVFDPGCDVNKRGCFAKGQACCRFCESGTFQDIPCVANMTTASPPTAASGLVLETARLEQSQQSAAAVPQLISNVPRRRPPQRSRQSAPARQTTGEELHLGSSVSLRWRRRKEGQHSA
ncbi:unnamed protein product [Vitrella brassicaformis CCMP3155]|uniref:glucan endo-1,3-beta-D-glucosidase n=1 Tax=Vitrella brassicaformis (strain CCMP3155) TaxID=1169540 RepID=A0A0G4EMB6_VITBC|nr:unnamed protein product [Vitrella brassicaformis CCMP3155]|eukprot:CEL98309.1 unnamed protein product [Vitrella brassicaformis CCMP3155]